MVAAISSELVTLPLTATSIFRMRLLEKLLLFFSLDFKELIQ